MKPVVLSLALGLFPLEAVADPASIVVEAAARMEASNGTIAGYTFEFETGSRFFSVWACTDCPAATRIDVGAIQRPARELPVEAALQQIALCPVEACTAETSVSANAPTVILRQINIRGAHLVQATAFLESSFVVVSAESADPALAEKIYTGVFELMMPGLIEHTN